MNYISTRDARLTNESVSAACAIKRGLAINGGLYMPRRIPQLEEGELASFLPLSYEALAAKVIAKYLTDFTEEELLSYAGLAYSPDRFPEGAIALSPEIGGQFFIELWHGPTCAFKDMALQLMPRLLAASLKKTAEHRTAVILVATSGDTGKAALEGFSGVDGVKIQVFYPKGGVSRVQELQMVTQEGGNVKVSAVEGNFDTAQTELKRIFIDKEFAKTVRESEAILTSANSINFGRLVPQVVYYVYSYLELVRCGRVSLGSPVDVCVPTGNFGNILAAYMAKRMGVPFRRFICASNQNNVLTDFIRTGHYTKKRDFHLTISPSMDILVSSNLERLLYLIAGDEKVRLWMRALRETGEYTVDPETLAALQSEFSGYFCGETETKETIRRTFDSFGYLIDTHTAVAANCAEQYRRETGGDLPILTASTASPFKFAAAVYEALTGEHTDDALKALDLLAARAGRPIPAPLAACTKKPVRFTETVTTDGMRPSIAEFIR
ncbi:MAG: threonine synthase [Clostridia bacterium]|nr:threonine synthase [Clostridia bacterium]